MLARAQEEIGDVVDCRQLLVGDVPEEVHVAHAEPRDERMQHRVVRLEPAVGADQQEPRARVVPCSIDVKRPDEILELLVGNYPSDKQDVRPAVVEISRFEFARRTVEVREIWDDRQDVTGRELELLQLLTVVVGVAKRDVAARRTRSARAVRESTT